MTGPFAEARNRLAGSSLKAAFVAYAVIALLAAILLSFLSTGLLGMVAERTLPDEPYAHSGTYVYDAQADVLVPAEALSWYEDSAANALSGDDSTEGSAGEVVLLFVESSARRNAEPIDLSDPPADVADGSIADVSWPQGFDAEDGGGLVFSELAAYDAQAAASRPGGDVAAALAEELPKNAEGERPLVSNVGYYVPYPNDPALYRAIAGAAITSVPVLFAACFVVAGRLFYRNRIAGPLEAMDEAAVKIAQGDLDFSVGLQRDDELGRLCGRFEDMRSELARSKRKTWRAVENRRRVNAAFAHDVRTPLTVVQGRADFIKLVSDDERVGKAASVISRQAGRLAALADSMNGLESVEAEPVRPSAVDLGEILQHVEDVARGAAEAAGVSATVEGRPGDLRVMADEGSVLRVADNLVSNAVRHASSKIAVVLSWEDEALSLSVSDDGPGFKDAAERALEPFWRGPGEASSSAGGSDGHLGLGLYLCSVLCGKHGGELTVGDGPQGGAFALATFSAPECTEDSAG